MAKSYWTARQLYSWAVFGNESAIGKREEPPAKLRSFVEVRIELPAAIGRKELAGSILVGHDRVSLDPQQFRDHPNMTIDESGEIVRLRPYKKGELPMRGSQALFGAREAKLVFPNKIDQAEQWLRTYMKSNPMAKKLAAVADCQQAGFTSRAADRAWKKVGREYGRGCGKRIKTAEG